MGSAQSKMAQVTRSDETQDARAPPTNAPPPLPSRPNLPTIAVPPGENDPFSAGNNSNPPASASEHPQTPSSPQQPRSRRGSFSFLRRSKSRGEISETKKEPGSGPRKLSRRKKDRNVSKEEATNQLKMPPQLPSYHNLPQMNTPFVDGAPNPSFLPTHNGHSVAPTPSSTLERPASKSGYDPHAFYRKHLGMAERSTPPQPSREVTPTAAGSSPPSAYQDPYGRTERYVGQPGISLLLPPIPYSAKVTCKHTYPSLPDVSQS